MIVLFTMLCCKKHLYFKRSTSHLQLVGIYLLENQPGRSRRSDNEYLYRAWFSFSEKKWSKLVESLLNFTGTNFSMIISNWIPVINAMCKKESLFHTSLVVMHWAARNFGRTCLISRYRLSLEEHRVHFLSPNRGYGFWDSYSEGTTLIHFT